MLINGMSVSKNQNKKCKVSLTEEKQLKLTQEKVLNVFFFLLKISFKNNNFNKLNFFLD